MKSMKILFLGDNENAVRDIKDILYKEETLCWYKFHDMDSAGFTTEEFDIVILEDTPVDAERFHNIIKLNCHLTKPILIITGNISAAEEISIWGMGVTDIIRLPITKDECRTIIDNSYRLIWYYKKFRQ